MTEKKLTPEQEAAVIERRRQWRAGLLQSIAHDFGCSISTVRRIERAWQQRMGFRVNRKGPTSIHAAESES